MKARRDFAPIYAYWDNAIQLLPEYPSECGRSYESGGRRRAHFTIAAGA